MNIAEGANPMTESPRRQIGDKVLVSRDNYAWRCTIIAVREDNGQPPSHYKVRTEDDETFWALDFEISEADDA